MSLKNTCQSIGSQFGKTIILGGALAAWLGCMSEGSAPAADLIARFNLAATGVYLVERHLFGVRI